MHNLLVVLLTKEFQQLINVISMKIDGNVFVASHL